MPKTGVHWFRHGLRIHDNPALLSCLDEVERFIPIYIFDGKTSGTDICGYLRFRFLIESLKDLEKQFKSFGINFMCFFGEADQVFERLIKDYEIKIISFEKDSEAVWAKRDNAVKNLCKKYDVQVIERVSHTLYDPDEICSLNNGAPPNTYELLKQTCLKIGDPAEPLSRPDLKFYSSHLKNTNDIYEERIHHVPDLDYFNMKPECKEQENPLFKGGETKGLELYEKRYQQEKESFKKGVINVNITKPIMSFNEIPLSPYFRFGCISVRKFYFELKRAYFKYFKGDRKPFVPVEQLYLREFFYHLSYKNDKFDQIDGNIIAPKIPWDYDRDHLLKKWENGQTGFPWIDACMRQLKQEGWIHHVCRDSVAVFLTRGHCFLSWHIGQQIFQRHLIDADWSINAGNWNWISSVDPEELTDCDYLSNICQIKYAKKVDINGEYTRKYCPEVKEIPLEYLFEPWKAPLNIQEEANCIVGKDYPVPCLDLEQTGRENIFKLQQFFQSEKKNIFTLFHNEIKLESRKKKSSSEYRIGFKTSFRYV